MGGEDRRRVAVVGARGIGKHHANWWTLEGAHVCGFAGTSDQTVKETGRMLHETFGIEARGYVDLDAMLEAERPDIVDVCTPAQLHFEHARAALEAGCYVLCEKPFVYDNSLSRHEMLDQCMELIEIAHRRSLRLGVCTQYTVGARVFLELWRQAKGDEPVRHYHGHLEAPAKGRAPDPQRIWVDLAPHTLSVLSEAVPGGKVDWNSAEASFRGHESVVRFQVATDKGEHVACEIVTRNATEPPSNTRHFKINGYAFQVEGGKDAEGVYCARIATPDGEHERPDFMRLLIRQFLAGDVVADGRYGMENVDMLVRFLDIARASL